jgi:hypothetical protein
MERTADVMFGTQESGAGRSVLRLLAFVWVMLGMGLLSLVPPALALLFSGNVVGALNAVGVGLFLAGAATASGSLFGFLFGVPKSAVNNGPDQMPRTGDEPAYVPNTSLETISDWLTKAIVGIGLVQFDEILDLIGRVGATAGAAMGGTTVWQVIATSLLVHNLLMGFFQGFLVAYIYLPRVFNSIRIMQMSGAAQPAAGRTGQDTSATSTPAP